MGSPKPLCRKLLPIITPETLGTLLVKERNVHRQETQSQSVTRGLESQGSTQLPTLVKQAYCLLTPSFCPPLPQTNLEFKIPLP